MSGFPRDPAFDNTVALLREGYDFISNRCEGLSADMFETRILMRKVVCMRGRDAAELAYDSEHVTRVGAMPPTVLRLLQGRGSVQTLDDRAHRHRKAMFLALLTSGPQVARLRALTRDEWLRSLVEWERRGEFVLFDEVNAVLTRAACAWVGVPLDGRRAVSMTRALTAMIENAGSFGPHNWSAQLLRFRTEWFVRSIVKRVRDRTLELAPDAPLRAIVEHRDIQDNRLDTATAAIEIINLIRPVVAIGRFIVFAAMALHQHRVWREEFEAGKEERLEPFVEEVRRLYPFFPLIGGRIRADFMWHGHNLGKGQWILFDLHGTNHHPALFPEPYQFCPERSLSWTTQDFAFVPHGAGDARRTHRCPGEMVTVGLMKEAIRLLARAMQYEVPHQDLSVDLRRIPARPASGFVISNVRRKDVDAL